MPLRFKFGKIPARASSQAEAHHGAVHVRAPRKVALWTATLFLALLAANGALGFWLGRLQGTKGRSFGVSGQAVFRSDWRDGFETRPTEEAAGRTFQGKPGPWGNLECQQTVMEMAPEYLPVSYHIGQSNRWCFKGWSPARVKSLLERAALSSQQRAELLNTNRWHQKPDAVYVLPSDSTILTLSPETRSIIYAELARHKENAPQCNPFHWEDDLDTLFAGATLSAETRARFEQVSYRRGSVVLVADLPVVLRSLSDPAQQAALVKVLSRQPVLFASLQLTPETDVEALIQYWGVHGYARDIRPVLEAAARIPQTRRLSIAALLPPSARALLYTFPLPEAAPQPNCHWTAFNFFKEKADPPTDDENYWLNKLRTEYRPVRGEPRYGDLLVLSRPDCQFLHTCVYLADDIVYTKNGVSRWAPWQLMRRADLLAFYSWDLVPGQQLAVQYYRLSGAAVSESAASP